MKKILKRICLISKIYFKRKYIILQIVPNNCALNDTAFIVRNDSYRAKLYVLQRIFFMICYLKEKNSCKFHINFTKLIIYKIKINRIVIQK